MPAADWLPREVIEALEAEFETLDEALLVALNSPGVGGELAARGVVDMSGFGPAEVYVPPAQERYVWPRVAEYHGLEPHARGRKVGRPDGSVPHQTFWRIFELVLTEDASARRVEKESDNDPNLVFVNRKKVGPTLKWIRAHRIEAHQAWARRKIPTEFSATPDGVFLLKP